MHPHPGPPLRALALGLLAAGSVGCSATPRHMSLQDVLTGRSTLRKDGPPSREPELPGTRLTTVCTLGAARPAAHAYGDEYSSSLTLYESAVRFDARELSPTGRRDRWSIEVQRDARPTAVDARHADEYYLAAELPWGGLSLERWDLAPQPYAWCASRAVAKAPLGDPAEPDETTLTRPEHYHHPDLRAERHFHRTSFAVPADWLWIRELAVDPEGRFLLALVETARDDSTLFRYDLRREVSEFVADGSTQPALIVCDGIRFADTQDGGRAALLTTTTSHTWMLLDADRDGLHESSELYDAAAFSSAGEPRIARRY